MAASTPDTSFVSISPSENPPQTPLSIISSINEDEDSFILNSPSINTSPKHKFHPPTFKPRQVYQHRNSTSNLINHQKHPNQNTDDNHPLFKRRSSIQTLTKIQKDKLFDDQSDDYIDDSLIYNVPIASHSSLGIFNSSIVNTNNKKPWNSSNPNLLIPPSPLPGCSSTWIDSPNLKSNPSFNILSPEAKQLSTFYEMNLQSIANEEIQRRSKFNMYHIGESLDDLKLASNEKNNTISITRPSWFPPKNKTEVKSHESQYQEMITLQSKNSLRESKLREQMNSLRLIGDERLGYLTTKSTLTPKNINEIKNYIGGSKITCATKMKLLKMCIDYKMGENNLTPSTKLEGHWEIIEESLISSGYTTNQTNQLMDWLSHIFNDKFREKFTKNLDSNVVIKQLKDFQDDLNLLNFNNCIAMISKLPPDVLVRVIEMIISSWCFQTGKAIKRLLSLAICILREYHFGWSNIQMLLLNEETNIYIGDFERDQICFWDKVNVYYNKL